MTLLLGTWLLGGMFVDGWAHNRFGETLETFFTPWHALFDTELNSSSEMSEKRRHPFRAAQLRIFFDSYGFKLSPGHVRAQLCAERMEKIRF